MRIIWLAVLTALSPAVAMAASSVIVVSPVAAFSDPSRIAENVREECHQLPSYQGERVRRQLQSHGLTVQTGPGQDVPSQGTFLLVRIQDAISAGNAFVGHRKQVGTTATLFEDGREVAQSTHARSSSGGFGAGFKGSCTVLERCADTLAKDIANWLKRELARLPGPSDRPDPAVREK